MNPVRVPENKMGEVLLSEWEAMKSAPLLRILILYCVSESAGII